MKTFFAAKSRLCHSHPTLLLHVTNMKSSITCPKYITSSPSCGI
uniref:Uncharacterized protein n=1 Tax=Arundo donax TaxID=35708 RepID=A0A0A9ECI6_ARUDO